MGRAGQVTTNRGDALAPNSCGAARNKIATRGARVVTPHTPQLRGMVGRGAPRPAITDPQAH